MQGSTLSPADLLGEAVAGITQRPGRAGLTMLGTVLGIGALVAILGLSDTASAQISKQFNVLDATQVTVTDTGDTSDRPGYDFPGDADRRVEALGGVIAAGVVWQLPAPASLGVLPNSAASSGLNLYAASPGALVAAEPTVTAGVLLNSFDEATHQKVAVLSAAAAVQLRVSSLAGAPAVFVGGQPFTVIGIVTGELRLPELGFGIMIPASTSLDIWGPPAPSHAASMLIRTRLGAPTLVAREAPVALRPDHPALLAAVAGFDPTQLRHSVTGSLNSLLVVLALVALVIGAAGIANATVIAILERSAEIGLRRALGARRVHIAAQFLAETVTLGLVGGTIVASLGAATTVAVALERHWTAVLNPAYVLAAPFAGAAVGLLAGIYPSLGAATIEPAEALRS